MDTQVIETNQTPENDKGFSLIELLIVIVILGILATVTVFAVGGITDRGQASACDAEYKTIEVALEAAAAQGGDAVWTAFVRTVPENHTVNAATGVITPAGDCLDTTPVTPPVTEPEG